MIFIILAANPAKFIFTLITCYMHAPSTFVNWNLAFRTIIGNIFLIKITMTFLNCIDFYGIVVVKYKYIVVLLTK